MQDGAEAEAVPPGRAEVGDLHPLVTLGDFLSPFQERLSGSNQAGRRQRHQLRERRKMVEGKKRNDEK